MHGGRGQLLRVREAVGGRHGRVRVLGHHHHHHGVVGQDAWRVGGHVRGLGHAVVMRALGGGVAVLAGGGGSVAAPQAAAGGVLGFAAAAGARVGPAGFSAPAGGGLLPSAHGAARAFTAAASLAFAPRRSAAPAPCNQTENIF